MIGKIYTFTVTVAAGSMPHPGASMGAGRTVPEWDESITVNVEAASLEEAWEVAEERGWDFADEIVPEWQRQHSDDDPLRDHPDRDDVQVTARFDDLVVATTRRPAE